MILNPLKFIIDKLSSLQIAKFTQISGQSKQIKTNRVLFTNSKFQIPISLQLFNIWLQKYED